MTSQARSEAVVPVPIAAATALVSEETIRREAEAAMYAKA